MVSLKAVVLWVACAYVPHGRDISFRHHSHNLAHLCSCTRNLNKPAIQKTGLARTNGYTDSILQNSIHSVWSCHLIFSTLGALIDHARIRHIGAQQEVHTPAGSAGNWGLDDGRLDAKYD